jgi:hypothetical protein
MRNKKNIFVLGFIFTLITLVVFQNCAKMGQVSSPSVTKNSQSSTASSSGSASSGSAQSGNGGFTPGGLIGGTGETGSGSSSGSSGSGSGGGSTSPAPVPGSNPTLPPVTSPPSTPVNSDCSITVVSPTLTTGVNQSLLIDVNVNKQKYPNASRIYWMGTRNTIQDAYGTYFSESTSLSDGPRLSFPASNMNSGVYKRKGLVRDTAGNLVCETNEVNVTFISSTARSEACILRYSMNKFGIRAVPNNDGRPYSWNNWDIPEKFNMVETTTTNEDIRVRVEVVNQYGKVLTDTQSFTFVWGGSSSIESLPGKLYNDFRTTYLGSEMDAATFSQGAAYGVSSALASKSNFLFAQVFDADGRYVCRTPEVEMSFPK